MSSINFYNAIGSKYVKKTQRYKNYDQVRISVPNRFIIVGSGGSGKTNVLMNLIFSMNCWTKIFLFVRCPTEPLYAFLIDSLRAVEEKLDKQILFVSSTLDDLPEVNDFPKEPTLVVFDDMIQSNKKDFARMAELFVRGRKHGQDERPAAYGISPIFISQSYYGIDKLIRQNVDCVLFKKLNQRDLKLVMTEYASDKTAEQLLEMYKKCNTSDVCNWFMIDASPGQDPRYKYRHNYTPIEDEVAN